MTGSHRPPLTGGEHYDYVIGTGQVLFFERDRRFQLGGSVAALRDVIAYMGLVSTCAQTVSDLSYWQACRDESRTMGVANAVEGVKWAAQRGRISHQDAAALAYRSYLYPDEVELRLQLPAVEPSTVFTGCLPMLVTKKSAGDDRFMSLLIQLLRALPGTVTQQNLEELMFVEFEAQGRTNIRSSYRDRYLR